jgi:hypothetical protein
MKTVTLEEFFRFRPCYSKKRLKEIAGCKENWSALDILKIESVPAADRLWAVLFEELIDAPILHEFACRCAENALKRIESPDLRSVAAIEAKRKWLRGELTDSELNATRAAARAAAWDAACASARDAARDAACAAARDNQVKLLIDMLEDSK